MSKVSKNRLANVKNPYQGDFKKVLCVCSAGLLRSPTAAWVLSRDPWNYNTRAVGYNEEYALTVLDAAHLEWCDSCVVMDNTQKRVVSNMLDEYGLSRPVHVLDVTDDYDYRDPELVSLLTEKLSKVFEV